MPKSPRLWEIDALRGSAILLMISFHIAFDLAYFLPSVIVFFRKIKRIKL